ncbi:MAG TPA: RagB/SusD family nutrient uptake outer membrane protein [Pedobacter sp.]|nr:RagB/SusD family nutrient uptake outer membrane protein [Pedobacter sp.]
MKKNYIKLIFGVAVCSVLLLPTGCKKGYFDTVPDDIIKVEDIFNSKGQTEQWLAGLYSTIPDIWAMPYGFLYSVTSDELDASQWTNPAANTGSITAGSNNISGKGYYEKIRLATIFLQKIEGNKEISSLTNGPQLIKQYKGEARFLRAYYYWLMMRDMGPVVIVDPNKVAETSDTNQIPRSTWDDCVKFVIAEMELAKNDVQVNDFTVGSSNLSAIQTGRINQMIVSAVQSQILLYNASPLFNGNTELADFKNLDGKQLFNQTADASRWQKAADAAKAAITLAEGNGKALFKVNDADPFKAAFLSCRNLFWDGAKTEGVWLMPRSNYLLGDSYDGWEINCSPRSIQGGGYNGMGVVQGLVDDFRMADGTDKNANALYKENTYTVTASDYYVVGTNTMYTNREPRFYVDITFNGAVNPGVAEANVGATNNSRVEFFKTGSSGVGGNSRNSPKTGYLARKNFHPSFFAGGTITHRPSMLIRLAELYLNYAEALNESSTGDRNEMLTYLNKVRTRAGLPVLTDLGKVEMRNQIRLERRIELCFEAGIRYFDVRRWKVADQPGFNQGGDFFGMNMNGGTSLSDPAFHVRTKAFNRTPWQRRMYFLPYGQDEMDRNKQLVQFPGY